MPRKLSYIYFWSSLAGIRNNPKICDLTNNDISNANSFTIQSDMNRKMMFLNPIFKNSPYINLDKMKENKIKGK